MTLPDNTTETTQTTTVNNTMTTPPDAHTTMWVAMVTILVLGGLSYAGIISDPKVEILAVFATYAGLRYILPKTEVKI